MAFNHDDQVREIAKYFVERRSDASKFVTLRRTKTVLTQIKVQVRGHPRQAICDPSRGRLRILGCEERGRRTALPHSQPGAARQQAPQEGTKNQAAEYHRGVFQSTHLNCQKPTRCKLCTK